MLMVRVVNKKHHPPAPDAVRVYIGRGSPLGNLFKVIPHGLYRREEAVKEHEG